jgi:tetratricopeptide (TPR) repeat protein
LNGLAKLYRDEGRYDEAEKLYKRALEIRLAALGKDHQDTAEIIGNLGGLHRDTHNYSESEKCYNEALKIDRKLLGETHPYVATDMNNLAGLYRDMGRHEEAKTLFNKALSMRELSLGPNHPYCAKSLLGMVENSRQAGWKNDDAERLVRSAKTTRTMPPHVIPRSTTISRRAIFKKRSCITKPHYACAENCWVQPIPICRLPSKTKPYCLRHKPRKAENC